jgi:hypothetical protein
MVRYMEVEDDGEYQSYAIKFIKVQYKDGDYDI